ncbi:MAG TPA: PhoH family protein, partial [Stellaceae bacterium]|nr:PhoH family protein [Stellaceae bacterium]
MNAAVTSSSEKAAAGQGRVTMQFDDNMLLPQLFGERDQHLERIERQLGVSVVSRGNRLAVAGPEAATEIARTALVALYDRLKRGMEVDAAAVDAALRMANRAPAGDAVPLWDDAMAIHTRKRRITARSPNQAAYIRSLREREMVFGLGSAGTGKTYLAVAAAVDNLMSGAVARIILSRPAVEAGERLGFLPGDLREKVDPYLRPLYDALYDLVDPEKVDKMLEKNVIEVAPLAFMRGRTLNDAFIIMDEAQNTTIEQMKMFLTRMGNNSKAVITGDITQIDLPNPRKSGLLDAINILDGVEGISFCHFADGDVVRHALVQRIVRAYDASKPQQQELPLALGEGIESRTDQQ